MDSVTCERCEENLDERDVVEESFVCWKCGWKVKRPAKRKYDLDDLDDMLEDYLDTFSYSVD